MHPDALSATLSALADPTRRAILAQLKGRDLPVTELARSYDMSLAAVSKHLKVLEGAGLVSRSREAQWRPCHFEGAPLAAVSTFLEDFRQFWDASLDELDGYLQTMKREAAHHEPKKKTSARKRRKERR